MRRWREPSRPPLRLQPRRWTGAGRPGIYPQLLRPVPPLANCVQHTYQCARGPCAAREQNRPTCVRSVRRRPVRGMKNHDSRTGADDWVRAASALRSSRPQRTQETPRPADGVNLTSSVLGLLRPRKTWRKMTTFSLDSVGRLCACPGPGACFITGETRLGGHRAVCGRHAGPVLGGACVEARPRQGHPPRRAVRSRNGSTRGYEAKRPHAPSLWQGTQTCKRPRMMGCRKRLGGRGTDQRPSGQRPLGHRGPIPFPALGDFWRQCVVVKAPPRGASEEAPGDIGRPRFKSPIPG